MTMVPNPDPNLGRDTLRPPGGKRGRRGWIDVAAGLALLAIAVAVYAAVRARTGPPGAPFADYLAIAVPLLAGAALVVRGGWRLARPGRDDRDGVAPIEFEVRGVGYKSFVAWRYLLVGNRKIRPVTQRLLATGLGTLGLIALLRAAHLEPAATQLHNPMWVAEMVALVFIAAVVFLGVLPHSKPALILGLLGLLVFVVCGAGFVLLGHGMLPMLHLEFERLAAVEQALKIAAIAGAAFAGIAMFFGCLRAYFTFFTTVPIGGVWIGTAALVIVLSVMGGFESDLREKILGSNAHVQITREDGDFVEWRKVKAQIDSMPGVVASTPYAVSEVVIAANNTGMPVIIKGIDPNSVGRVTDLVSDLEPEDRDAMKRLEPLISDGHDLRVPQRPRTGPVIDPPPPDLPTPGEPIDFSGESAPGDDGAPSGSAARDGHGPPSAAGGGHASDRGGDPGAGHAGDDGSPGPAADRGSVHSGDAVRELGEYDPPPPRPRGDDEPRAATHDPAPPEDQGAPPGPAAIGAAPAGSAAPGPAVIDPPPPDLVTSDEPPADYSQPGYLQDAVKVIEPPFEAPTLSRRTQSLPGILVGKELVKQTHLYTGEEVRVVSPLSDPSNPDATGTPIPFNRDYRVAGKFFTGMYEYDLKYVYVTLDSLQEFLDRGDAIDGIEVRVVNPYETDAFVAKLQAAFGPHYRVQDWKELNRSLFSALKLEKIAMFLVLGIVILVASFSIVGNLIMVVVEKAREIALLKTLGATDVGVMQLFAIQGLMIGVIGTVLGVATGLLGCWALSSFGFPLDVDVYYIDRLPIHVDPASVVAAASAGVLISIAATLYPAVVAARVRPAAGMRQ